MADITFENIKTGEKVTFTADQDPMARRAHLAAYLNSSNLSPNALKGQDFGWRLAPELVAKIETIRGDLQTMDMLSRRIGVSIEDVRDYHILDYVAEQTFAEEAMALQKQSPSNKFESDYEARLRAIREGKSEDSDSAAQSDSAKIEPAKANNKKEQ